MKRLALLFSIIVLASGISLGQTTASTYRGKLPITPPAAAPVITAAAAAERLRFTAPSNIVRMQLQVISESGQILFDVTSKGNVLDWSLQDSSGQRLQGSYLTIVTVKSVSGRLSERVGSVLVQEKQVELQRVDTMKLSPAQQQAVGPVEENAALTILKAGEAEAVTALANHNGEGQIIRDRGALSFRLGDLFSGDDKEQMRLTEEGNLGIGTKEPQAKLDVAGDIRATGLRLEKGVEFADGTVQTTGLSGRMDKDGNLIPNAAGSGTQNRIAKWTETGGAGTLGDAAISETNGSTIFGQNSSGQVAPLFPTSPTYHVLEVGAPGSKSPLTLAGGSGVMEFWKDLGGGTGSPAAAVSFGMAQPGAAATDDMVFSTFTQAAGSWSERMRLTTNGNLGIGTTAPAAVLDVVGKPTDGFGDGGTVLRVIGGNGFDLFESAGWGANVLLQAGNGGNNTGFGNQNPFGGNGGSITLQPGTGGSGAFGSFNGLTGNVLLAPSAGNVAIGTISNFDIHNKLSVVGNADFTGNVGIGTNAPGYRLDVVGRSRIRQNAGQTGGTNTAGLWLYQNNTPAADRAFVGMESDNSVGFYGNNGAGWGLIMNTQTGDVGIGTGTPTSKLTVAGTVESKSGGFKFPDGSVQTSAAAAAAANAIYTTRTYTDGAELPCCTLTYTTLLHLNLPAGSYLLSANVQFRNAANFFNEDNSRTVNCRFSTDDDSNFGSAFKLQSLTRSTMSLHSVTAIPAGGVDFQCRDSTSPLQTSHASSAIFPEARRFTAVKIDGNVIVQ